MSHYANLQTLFSSATESYIEDQINKSVSESLKPVQTLLTSSKEEVIALTTEKNKLLSSLEVSNSKIKELEKTILTHQAKISELEAVIANQPVIPGPVVSYKDNGYPWIDWADLAQPSDDLDTGLRRLTKRMNVRLPAGLYEFSDFKHALYEPNGQGYAVFAPFCMGIRGAGKNKTVLQMRPMSSTRSSWVPPQKDPVTGKGTGKTNQLSVLRLGGEVTDQIITADFTLSMTEQGHLYNGWSHYGGTGSHSYNCRVTGGAGDWNAPPGETFMNNGYRDTDLTIENMETDGFIYVWSKNTDGTLSSTKGRRTGGSPFGNNASKNQKIINPDFHDSFVSSLTSSFTGMPHTGSSPFGWTTVDAKLSRNANHIVGEGKTFTGINHEGTKGPVRHIRPFIDMVANPHQSSHMSFGSAQEDNADVEIHDPTWTTSPNWSSGCFAINMGDKYWANISGVFDGVNRWKTVPKVFIDGVQLTPFHWWDSQPRPTGLDPKKQFVVKH